MAVRNPQVVSFARFYGVTVHTCEPADPASKGGSESTVKIAKADLVPTDTNLLEAYDTFAELEAACERVCDDVNGRVHRVTRRTPVEMLAKEQARLHPVPAVPHTVAFGLVRSVPARTPMVALDHAQYSVPHQLMGQQVWVRVSGQGPDEKVITCTSDRRGRSRSLVMSERLRAARRSSTRTSHPSRRGRWIGSRRRKMQLRLSSWPLAAARGCG